MFTGGNYFIKHRSKKTDPTYPPLIDLATFCSNSRRFCRRTSAASADRVHMDVHVHCVIKGDVSIKLWAKFRNWYILKMET